MVVANGDLMGISAVEASGVFVGAGDRDSSSSSVLYYIQHRLFRIDGGKDFSTVLSQTFMIANFIHCRIVCTRYKSMSTRLYARRAIAIQMMARAAPRR